jgi:hypothetical protein
LIPIFRHRPACPGDPISFHSEGKWVARMKRAMTELCAKRQTPSASRLLKKSPIFVAGFGAEAWRL